MLTFDSLAEACDADARIRHTRVRVLAGEAHIASTRAVRDALPGDRRPDTAIRPLRTDRRPHGRRAKGSRR